MTTVTSVREDAVSFDLTICDDMPEVFADGFSQMMLGSPLTKLTLHTVTMPVSEGNAIEQRKGILRLVISTPVLLEMCRNVLANAQGAMHIIAQTGYQMDSQIQKLMEGVSIVQANGESSHESSPNAS